MLHLTHAIDRATGFVFVPAAEAQEAPPDTIDASTASQAEKPNPYALFTSAARPLPGLRSNIQDVQERWIDAKEEWDAYENAQWRQEGESMRDSMQDNH